MEQQSKSKPLLSICIPTYNRSRYLKKSIDSIITQKEFLNGTVEIIISDNASTDDTEQVVSKYIEKYPNIFYSKNEVNVRDRNFPTVLSKAHGKSRRLCNDTLVFREGALKNMCAVIRENEEQRPFLFWSNGASKNKEDIHKTDFKGYVHNVSFWMTSIACFSIWDDQCEDIGTDYEGCELLLWQERKGLQIAKEKDDVVIVNTVLAGVQTVAKKDISYGLYKIFYENYFSILKPYFTDGSLPDGEKEYLEKDLLFHFFLDWCAKWELQEDNLDYSRTENLKNTVWNQYKGKPYWQEFLVKYYLKLTLMKCRKTAKRILGRE